MREWIVCIILLLSNIIAGPACGATGEVSVDEESSSQEDSLPDLGSDKNTQQAKKSGKQALAESGGSYLVSSAMQDFSNLTPEALKSQAQSYLQNQVTSSAQTYLDSVLSPYGKLRTNLSVGERGDLDGSSLDYFG